MIGNALKRDGFDVDIAFSGEDGLDRLPQLGPLAVILDLGLPGIDGFETCRRIREVSDVHIIMLTVSNDEYEKVLAFSNGADDFLTKPISNRELVARLRSVLRRREGKSRKRLIVGPVAIDVPARTVEVGDATIALTRIEFDLFYELVRRVNTVVPREDLQSLVWGPEWSGGSHLVEVHVSKVRRKLSDAGVTSFIRTVREVGYRVDAVA